MDNQNAAAQANLDKTRVPVVSRCQKKCHSTDLRKAWGMRYVPSGYGPRQYQKGYKYCRSCEMLVTGQRGLRCPCCNFIFKSSPRKTKYKKYTRY